MYILVKAKALTHEGASTLVSMLPLPCQLLLLWYVGDRQEAYRLVKDDNTWTHLTCLWRLMGSTHSAHNVTAIQAHSLPLQDY